MGDGLTVRVAVSRTDLALKLQRAGWSCWTSNVRLNGLMLIVADAVNREKQGVFPFSRDRARLLCSPLRPASAAACKAQREGLAVLAALGVIASARRGSRYPVALAAEHRFTSNRRFNVRLTLTPAQAERWHNREARAREVFERGNPIIGIIRETASRMEFSAQGMERLRQLPSTARNLVGSAERCFRWVNAPAGKLRLDSAGTLHSPISGCPKEIRPFLLLDGEEVLEVDISGAHLVMLPKVCTPDYLARYRIPHTAEAAEREMLSLIAQIESGDVYGGGSEAERKRRKTALLTSLNMPVNAQMAMPQTQPLIANRPLLAAAMRAAKRTDHRGLCQWLQRWTSDIVNASVLALHARGIPSIPIVDCLMVRRRDEEEARNELGARIHASTGVCAKIDGVRYSDCLALPTAQGALAA